jgi:hypothetical protein
MAMSWELKELDLLRSILGEEESQTRVMRQQLRVLKDIKTLLVPKKPNKIALQFDNQEPNMPGKASDKQTISCSAIETDDKGQPVTIDPANAQWSVDDTAVATVVTNPADGSGDFTAHAAGTTVVHLKDTATGAEGTNSLEITHDARSNTFAFVWGDPKDATA